MADGGLLLFGFCAVACLAVLPTAILAAAVFGAPPQPRFLGGWRQQSGWGMGAGLGGGDAVVMPAPGPGCAYLRVPVPRDGAEYLVVRADTFAGGDAPAPAPAATPEAAKAAEAESADKSA